MSSDNFGGAKLPSDKLDMNIQYISNVFTDDNTIVKRYITSPFDSKIKFCLVYADGMINNKLINDDIIYPMLHYHFSDGKLPLLETVEQMVTLSNDVVRTADVEKIVQGIIYGDTALIADGCSEALVLNTKGWTVRSISEPESERVLRGPREGFNESILINLSMVRRKLHTPDLKFRYLTFGRRTRTKACLCYLESLVNKRVLAELEKRLSGIDIDGTLDTNYLAEDIKDAPYSAIKTIGSTERPDVVAARLLEGRVAVFLDGTPSVLTVPHLFIEHFQSDEDYYLNYVFASIGRILRELAFFISISLPAVYVSMVTFHQEMLPTPLIMSIAAARQGVPFPTALEMIIMLVVFEMLRESGSRMPGLMGQTLSIVGALVIGQAAVQAKIVSAPIIIAIALTGICGLMVPRLKGYIIVHRFLLLAFSCIIGFYGYLLGLMIMLVGIFSTCSFGIPIISGTFAEGYRDRKDQMIRAPWRLMIRRPKFLTWNRVRQQKRSPEK